jgi:hypothetical protein
MATIGKFAGIARRLAAAIGGAVVAISALQPGDRVLGIFAASATV